MLIELLVLLNMRLFALLALLFMQIKQFFHLRAESLLFQLGDAVLRKFCLDVTTLGLTSCAMFLHSDATYTIKHMRKTNINFHSFTQLTELISALVEVR